MYLHVGKRVVVHAVVGIVLTQGGLQMKSSSTWSATASSAINTVHAAPIQPNADIDEHAER